LRNWCQRVTNLIVTGTQGTTIQTLRGWLLHTKALNSQALNTQQNFRTDLKACFREMVCIIFSTVTTITTSRCRHLSSRLSLSPQFVADAAVVAVAAVVDVAAVVFVAVGVAAAVVITGVAFVAVAFAPVVAVTAVVADALMPQLSAVVTVVVVVTIGFRPCCQCRRGCCRRPGCHCCRDCGCHRGCRCRRSLPLPVLEKSRSWVSGTPCKELF